MRIPSTTKLSPVLKALLAGVLFCLPVDAGDRSGASGWQPLTPLPEARVAAAVAACGDRIYLVGGVTDAEPRSRAVRAYEPASNSWASLADYPGPPIRSAAAIELDGHVYLFGGYLYDYEISDQVWRFDPSNGTWEPRAPMPEARLSASLHELNGRIFLLGGRTTPAWQYRNTVLIYDPSGDTTVSQAGAWSEATAAVLPSPLGDNAGASIGGDFFTLGSYEPSIPGRFLAYSARYDAWRVLPSSPLIGNFPAVVRLQGSLYAIESTGTTWSWEYTPEAAPGSGLQVVAPGGGPVFPPFVAEANRPETMYGAAVVAHGGRIFCFGGHAGPLTNHAWVFAP